jgi:DNA transposition AAA+ family ATPase
MATELEVQSLADAMWQLLDDMGEKGQSACLAAKAEARIAYEPFRDKNEEEFVDWMSLATAQQILRECS